MKPIPRRAFLKGTGATLALPWLEAMMPAHAATPAAEVPQRIAMLYMPNGVRPDRWTPEGDGSRFKLSPILNAEQGVIYGRWPLRENGWLVDWNDDY